MKVPIVSLFSPLPSDVNTTGGFRRLSMFLAALGRVGSTMEIAFYAAPEDIAEHGGLAAAEAILHVAGCRRLPGTDLR